jgi:type IV secretory pathway VirB10-like protein
MSDRDTELPPELTDLVEGMQRDVLEPERVARVARRLASTPSSGGTPPSKGLGWPWAIAGLVAIGAATWWWLHDPSVEPELTEGPAPAPAPGPAPELEPEPERVLDPVAPPPTASAEPSTPAAGASDPPTPAPTAEPIEPAPRRSRERRADETQASDVVEEHRLLAEARRVLEADPARALALADAHRRGFPHGLLAEEREYLRVTALAALGREADAQRAAAAFLRRWPGSAYRSEVARIGSP